MRWNGLLSTTAHDRQLMAGSSAANARSIVICESLSCWHAVGVRRVTIQWRHKRGLGGGIGHHHGHGHAKASAGRRYPMVVVSETASLTYSPLISFWTRRRRASDIARRAVSGV